MAEMKDSGIEWIGEIPEDWDVIRCKYISTFLNGYAFDSKDLQMDFMYPVIKNGGIDTINCQGVNNNYDIKDYLIKENDILLAMSGATVGKVGIAHNIENAYINQRVGIIRTDCPSYLFYCLSTKEFVEYILLCANGSAQPNVSADVYREFSIPLPPKEIKIKIADFLDEKCVEIDTLHSDIEKQIETLEEYKKSIITEAVTKGLDPDAEMKDSGIEWIGKMPKNWEIKKIKYVTKSINDIEHYMPNDSEDTDKVPYLMIGDLKDKISDVDFEKCKHISRKDYKVLSIKGKNNKGDVIFARYATIGTVMYIDENLDFLVSYACLTIKPQNNIYGKFLFYYFKSKAFFEDVNQYINTNTQGNIGKESLSKTKIAVPSIRKQQQIVKYLDIKCAEIDGVIVDKKKQLETLEQYKKSLIYEYVTGKKEVPDYE